MRGDKRNMVKLSDIDAYDNITHTGVFDSWTHGPLAHSGQWCTICREYVAPYVIHESFVAELARKIVSIQKEGHK